MAFNHSSSQQNILRQAITDAYRKDETSCVEQLLKQLSFSADSLDRIQHTALQLVSKTRQESQNQGAIVKLLHQYDLSSEQGLALMCLAEALLRIPDAHTRDLLISDKISTAEWLAHMQQDNSLFKNAASWSLLLTGKIFSSTQDSEKSLFSSLKRAITSPGIAVLRPIIQQGMKWLGNHFVSGQTIEEALKQALPLEKLGYRFSYDMLGEAARSAEDANRYFKSYAAAINAIGQSAATHDPIQSPGISIKLSALHPRYEYSQKKRVLQELIPRLLELIQLAKKYNIGVTIDAEEADRLDLSLDIFELLLAAPELENWEGLGMVVQAYQKRAPEVIDWLAALAQQQKRRLMIRLVKGAYWDSEIKQSQVLGLEGYPVFTRKNSTDLSYLVCAKKLLAQPTYFYPQFGTHNAHTVAAVLEMAGPSRNFEFQCLHGMGRPLYDQIVDSELLNIPTRIYAPVGNHQDLVGYLVRRLLENGANTSFINRVADKKMPLEQLIADPIEYIATQVYKPHPLIPLPQNIYPDRKNSQGLDLSNQNTLTTLTTALESLAQQTWQAAPLINGKSLKTVSTQEVVSPTRPDDLVGHAYQATEAEIQEALAVAEKAQSAWAQTTVDERATALESAADLFQQALPTLVSLLCREGGKTLPDSLSEVRETIDYCRYYALRARQDLLPKTLSGPTGELNQLSLHPRGLIICISPWNFPLAIFTGQILAALACGNSVIAKPAEQTPLIAAEAIRILHQAGIPPAALQLLPGKGPVVGAPLVADSRVSGVMFTGSTETAALINQVLAARPGPITPLIAETGGQNAMIVDSSALPEQVVLDVIQSAFNSAGQRCSALRVLFVQEELAPRLLPLLKGAMAELSLGDPSLLATDIGPVIDQEALQNLQGHREKMNQAAELLYELPLPPTLKGNYFAPCAFLLKDLSLLPREVFGPILHVLTFPATGVDNVLAMINRTGYGLTLGIHSRIESTIQYIQKKAAVGNMYVNRNMIGAVVGVQPFGGERLSGTGPKAGGPYYLPRLCVERSVSTNTAAVGGNTTLITLHEDEHAQN